MVTKIPRFAFEKFPQANDRLTTQMKSVGEVMAMGRTFRNPAESLRGLETGLRPGRALDRPRNHRPRSWASRGRNATLVRGDAFRIGMSAREIFEVTKIDPWFLAQIDLVAEEAAVKGQSLDALDADTLRRLKRKGFRPPLAACWAWIRAGAQQALGRRHPPGSTSASDTCAAEFATNTAYMYSTYEEECEAQPSTAENHGAGRRPNRIGQGIEFDYCCVHAAWRLREDPALRPSWSTATRKPCPPTTTPLTACTSSR